MCVCVYVCDSVYMCICMHIYVCVYMHICVCVCNQQRMLHSSSALSLMFELHCIGTHQGDYAPLLAIAGTSEIDRPARREERCEACERE